MLYIQIYNKPGSGLNMHQNGKIFVVEKEGTVNLSKVLSRGGFWGAVLSGGSFWPPSSLKNCTPKTGGGEMGSMSGRPKRYIGTCMKGLHI